MLDVTAQYANYAHAYLKMAAWMEERTDELIMMYEDRPFYNTKSSDYFNRDRRRKALDEIGAALGITGRPIKSSISLLSLR